MDPILAATGQSSEYSCQQVSAFCCCGSPGSGCSGFLFKLDGEKPLQSETSASGYGQAPFFAFVIGTSTVPKDGVT
jgi:hypothetical protein